MRDETMSKVLRNPKQEAAQTYDFKNAKRGVFLERAKIGIKTFQVTDAQDGKRRAKVERPERP